MIKELTILATIVLVGIIMDYLGMRQIGYLLIAIAVAITILLMILKSVKFIVSIIILLIILVVIIKFLQ